MSQTELRARTIKENIELASKCRKSFNVMHQPIFPNIPLENIVVDNLHMFLRVADVLIDLLIGALRTLDRIKESMKIHTTDGRTHLSTYEAALKSIGISGFTFWVGKTSKTLKWRTLTGTEKLLLFTKFNIADHFPDLKDFKIYGQNFLRLISYSQLNQKLQMSILKSLSQSQDFLLMILYACTRVSM